MAYLQSPETLKAGPQENRWKLLELVYGVLFEPRRTMPKVVKNPPLTNVLLLFTLIKTAETLIGLYSVPQSLIYGLPQELWVQVLPGLKIALPVLAFLGLAMNYFIWFILGGVFQLAAEILGGTGHGRVVFTITGLMALPAFLTIAVELFNRWLLSSSSLASGLTLLAELIYFLWSAGILIIGIREAHSLSTGKAIFTVTALPIFLICVLLLAAVLFFISWAFI